MEKQFSRPGTIAVARAVGRVTFREIIRDKILYNIVLCAILLLGLSFLAAQLSFVRQDRLIMDFGVSAVGISCAIIAIFTGSTLIAKEFDRRTILVALSRPISRFQFVLGKFLGLVGVITLNWALLNVVLGLLIQQGSGEEGLAFGSTFVLAQCLILFQSLLLAALTVFFSSFTTTSLAAVFAIGIYLVGNNISHLRLLAAKLENPVGKSLLDLLATVLPNLERFNLGLQVSYGIPVSTSYLAGSVVYAISVCGIAILLAGILLQKRES